MQLVESGSDGSPRRCAAPAALTRGHELHQCHDYHDTATARLTFGVNAESLMLSRAVVDRTELELVTPCVSCRSERFVELR